MCWNHYHIKLNQSYSSVPQNIFKSPGYLFSITYETSNVAGSLCTSNTMVFTRWDRKWVYGIAAETHKSRRIDCRRRLAHSAEQNAYKYGRISVASLVSSYPSDTRSLSYFLRRETVIGWSWMGPTSWTPILR